jgi:predicted DNA-binding protein YlxM (UPF0122 family)
MFDVIKKAGLSIAEAAQVVQISRVALFNWKAKRTEPHPQFERRLKMFEAFLKRLVDLDRLPLSEDLTKVERKEKVEKLKEMFSKYV